MALRALSLIVVRDRGTVDDIILTGVSANVSSLQKQVEPAR